MTIKWTTALISFFQPEDAYGWMDENQLLKLAPLPEEKKANISIKALVWILISILAGLAIGQLC